MKAKEMIKKTDKELLQMLTEGKKNLQNLHIEYKTKEVKNVKQIKLVKKDIARVLTVLKQREIEKGVKNG